MSKHEKKDCTTRKCTSEQQKKAIRRNYATRAASAKSSEVSTVNVRIKNYRDRNGGHPHVIVDDIDNNHVSVGFTHSPKKGKGHPNYALAINPLGGPGKAYMRRQGTIAPHSAYYESRNGIMTKPDYTKAQEYAERAKQKYIEKTHKKK